MAEKQSRIAILLDLNAKGFDTQLARAQRDLRRFGSQMKSVGRGMSLAVTAPLLAVGGASIKLAIDSLESLERPMVSYLCNLFFCVCWIAQSSSTKVT